MGASVRVNKWGLLSAFVRPCGMYWFSYIYSIMNKQTGINGLYRASSPELSLLTGRPMKLNRQRHLHYEEWDVSGTPVHWDCWKKQISERNIGEASLSFSVLIILLHTPTEEFQPLSWFQLLTTGEWPSHLYPLTYVSDLCDQIPIWHFHLNIAQKPQTKKKKPCNINPFLKQCSIDRVKTQTWKDL